MSQMENESQSYQKWLILYGENSYFTECQPKELNESIMQEMKTTLKKIKEGLKRKGKSEIKEGLKRKGKSEIKEGLKRKREERQKYNQQMKSQQQQGIDAQSSSQSQIDNPRLDKYYSSKRGYGQKYLPYYYIFERLSEKILNCPKVTNEYTYLCKTYIQEKRQIFKAVQDANQQLPIDGQDMEFISKWRDYYIYSNSKCAQIPNEQDNLKDKQYLKVQKVCKQQCNAILGCISEGKLEKKLKETFFPKKIGIIIRSSDLAKAQKLEYMSFIQTIRTNALGQLTVKMMYKVRFLLSVIVLEQRLYEVNQKVIETLKQTIRSSLSTDSVVHFPIRNMKAESAKFFCQIKMLRRVFTAIASHEGFFNFMNTNSQTRILNALIKQQNIFNAKDYDKVQYIRTFLNVDVYKGKSLGISIILQFTQQDNSAYIVNSSYSNMFKNQQKVGEKGYYKQWKKIYIQKNYNEYPLFRVITIIQMIKSPAAIMMFYLNQYQNYKAETIDQKFYPPSFQSYQKSHRLFKAQIDHIIGNAEKNISKSLRIPSIDFKFNSY